MKESEAGLEKDNSVIMTNSSNNDLNSLKTTLKSSRFSNFKGIFSFELSNLGNKVV